MQTDLNAMKFNFVKPTLTFLIIGVFIPGFTAIVLLGFQMLLTVIGIECTNAWTVIWTITTAAAIILPFLFLRQIISLPKEKLGILKTRLIVFNALEYIFIQSSLAPLFTNGRTLCYGAGGQNGLELIFTAWLALPLLLGFSLFLNYRWARKNILE